MVTEQRLNELLKTFLTDSSCPGAALGVVVDGEVVTTAAGVLNLNTGIEATPDSVFQIGRKAQGLRRLLCQGTKRLRSDATSL